MRCPQQGIPFIVFKGAALYADGLGAITQQIFGDVDILVGQGKTLSRCRVSGLP